MPLRDELRALEAEFHKLAGKADFLRADWTGPGPHKTPRWQITGDRYRRIAFEHLAERAGRLLEQVPPGFLPGGFSGDGIHAEQWLDAVAALEPAFFRADSDGPTVFRGGVPVGMIPCGAIEKPAWASELAAGRLADRLSEADNASPGAVCDVGFWSPKDIADRFGVPYDALRARLTRWRKKHAAGWMEVPAGERGPNDPRALYQLSAVKPVIADLKAKSAR